MTDNNWSIIITPKRKWFDIDWQAIWRYRDLYCMYVKRDITVVYKQTVLGPLWFLVEPILTTIIYMFVFGGLAGISTDGVPQSLFYMSGIMLWNYFSSVFTATSSTFISNAHVFGKVYFPRLIVPLSVTTSNLMKFFIQFMLFVVIWIYYASTGAHIALNWSIILLPAIILIVAIQSMSLGIIMSSLTTKYRDLTHLISFGIQLLMFATPIIYPMSVAPDKYRHIIEYNPLSSLFEALRYATMSCGSLHWSGILYSVIFTILILTLAVIIFNKTERNFMDTI